MTKPKLLLLCQAILSHNTTLSIFKQWQFRSNHNPFVDAVTLALTIKRLRLSAYVAPVLRTIIAIAIFCIAMSGVWEKCVQALKSYASCRGNGEGHGNPKSCLQRIFISSITQTESIRMGIGATAAGHDDYIAAVILDLCTKRGPHKTICPSEAARILAEDGGDWRARMEDIRRIGAALMSASRIEVTQRGTPVDPLIAKGPIRFRLTRA